MKIAIKEAQKSLYVPTAFCVGCVIVKNAKVISTGYSRESDGNTHAEQVALDKLSPIETEHSDLYTTMEPCSNRLSGNIPCVKRIIAAKVKRVFLAVEEPSDFVKCSGSEMLRIAGIEVVSVPGFADIALKIARGTSSQ